MDVIVFVYVITILIVLIVTSLVSCNMCNKQKEPTSQGATPEPASEENKATANESKVSSFNRSSYVTADVLQLRNETKSNKNSRIISTSIAQPDESTQLKDKSTQVNEKSTQAKEKTTKDKTTQAKDKADQVQDKSAQAKEKSAKSQRSQKGHGKSANKKIVLKRDDPGMTAPIFKTT